LPSTSNSDQKYSDNDHIRDVCDPNVDGDGVNNDVNNCPTISNSDQKDSDNDHIGDVCDPNVDGDGVNNDVDNCPTISNSDQVDSDSDRIGDVCDPDIDGDGVNNDANNCPIIKNGDQADLDSDRIGDVCDPDVDGDGVNNDVDNCHTVRNSDQKDSDHDSIGNACDPDIDGDGIPNTADNCPLTVNGDQIDTNDNGHGDACDVTAKNNGPYLYAVSQHPLNLVTSGGCLSGDTGCIPSTCAGPAVKNMVTTWTGQGVNAGVLQTSLGVYVATLSCTGMVNGEVLSDSMSMYLVVYDPMQGQVTGGGWFNSTLGAYAMKEILIGKANFGFNAKYQKVLLSPPVQLNLNLMR